MNYSQKLIIDHYRHYNKLPGKSMKFRDPNLKSILAIAFKMPPEKAIEFLKERGKNIISSKAWDEMTTEAHDKAFTVAKVMSADILQLIYDYIETAKTEGWSLQEFQDKLEPRLAEAGWWGKKETTDPDTGEKVISNITPSRLKVIFETNMQTSFSKGKYQQQKIIAELYPIWEYNQIQRKTKSPVHAQFDKKRFRHDDPIWNTIYPITRHGCKCSVVPYKDDGQNIENGSDYKDIIKENDNEFTIKPTKTWEPDVNKYIQGIKTDLENFLKKGAHVNS